MKKEYGRQAYFFVGAMSRMNCKVQAIILQERLDSWGGEIVKDWKTLHPSFGNPNNDPVNGESGGNLKTLEPIA